MLTMTNASRPQPPSPSRDQDIIGCHTLGRAVGAVYHSWYRASFQPEAKQKAISEGREVEGSVKFPSFLRDPSPGAGHPKPASFLPQSSPLLILLSLAWANNFHAMEQSSHYQRWVHLPTSGGFSMCRCKCPQKAKNIQKQFLCTASVVQAMAPNSFLSFP